MGGGVGWNFENLEVELRDDGFFGVKRLEGGDGRFIFGWVRFLDEVECRVRRYLRRSEN